MTHLNKGRNGWSATTNENATGYNWKIRTYKNGGGILISTAQAGIMEDKGGYASFTFMMFADPNITLLKTAARCTEKTVGAAHAEALTVFEQLKEAGKLPQNKSSNKTETAADVYKITKGQILWVDFIQTGATKLIVISEQDKSGYFKCLNPEKMTFSNHDRVRPYSEKFGIGTYYNEDERFEDMEALDNLIIEAAAATKKREADMQAHSVLMAAERAAKIEQGKKIVNVPAGAKAVIMARLMVDDSDIQTDYFASHAEDYFYLTYSNHTRDIFSEMRKAAGRADLEEIKAFNDVNFGRENKQKYSMGRGYFLSKDHSRSGIEISKQRFSYRDEPISADLLEKLYIAAAEGKYFCEDATQDINDIKTVAELIENLNVQIQPYSERAGIVFGDTKPIKDILKSLGCRFNPRLKVNGKQVMGWVFKLERMDEIKEAVQQAEQV